MPLRSLGLLLKEAHYFTFRAPRGVGRRYPVAVWDQQYRAGHWRRLDGPSELAHYLLIAGYAQQFHREPAVLDVGCGHGRLYELFRRFPHSRYVGLDVSTEAIRQASRMASDRAEFFVADFEAYASAERFDVIVFNESLYFAPRPDEILQRYAGMLTRDGVLIVSMCYNWWQAPIWTALQRRFAVLHAAEVRNERRQTWRVRVLGREDGGAAGRSRPAAEGEVTRCG